MLNAHTKQSLKTSYSKVRNVDNFHSSIKIQSAKYLKKTFKISKRQSTEFFFLIFTLSRFV